MPLFRAEKEREKDRVKSILALYSVFLAFATPIKFYFDVFFKILPYVALALRDSFFNHHFKSEVQI